jgi:hypothetical protein
VRRTHRAYCNHKHLCVRACSDAPMRVCDALRLTRDHGGRAHKFTSGGDGDGSVVGRGGGGVARNWAESNCVALERMSSPLAAPTRASNHPDTNTFETMLRVGRMQLCHAGDGAGCGATQTRPFRSRSPCISPTHDAHANVDISTHPQAVGGQVHALAKRACAISHSSETGAGGCVLRGGTLPGVCVMM